MPSPTDLLDAHINALYDDYQKKGRTKNARDELWSACVQMAGPVIFNFKRRMGQLQTANDAKFDECAHIAFEQCLDAPTFDRGKNFSTYYAKAVRYRLLDALRYTSSRERLAASMDFSPEFTHPAVMPPPHPADASDMVALKRSIKSLLSGLSLPALTAYAEYIQQSVRNPRTGVHQSVADMQHTSIGTAKSRLHAVKTQLQPLSRKIAEMEARHDASPEEMLTALSEALQELIAEKQRRCGNMSIS